MSMAEPVLELRAVAKRCPGGVEALRGVRLIIEEGEGCAIVGPSGSGKSTLLHIMGTLERASSGVVRIGGMDLAEASDGELAALRARRIGFVFQEDVIPEAHTALWHARDGRLYPGAPARERRRAAHAALERVGLGHRLEHPSARLSGG